MTPLIRPAAIGEESLIRNLLQPYLHELSQYGRIVPNRCGEYEYQYLDAYWTDPGRFPYIIMYGRRVAGFALVRKTRGLHQIAEFFILRAYRRQGLGLQAATAILERHKGGWRVEYYDSNGVAAGFWRRVATANARSGVAERAIGKGRSYLEFTVE